MITLSDEARQELEAYFDGKERKTIRLFATAGGCSGPRMALALDDAKDSDDVIVAEGFTFCIDKELLAQVKSASISMTYMGFTVDTEEPLPGAMEGGSSCCGSCSSCGSH